MTSDRNHPLHSVFTVWRWNRWILAILVGVSFVGYFLSWPIMRAVVQASSHYETPKLDQAVEIAYMPVISSGKLCPTLQAIYEKEFDIAVGFFSDCQEIGFWRAVKYVILAEMLGVKRPYW